MSEQLIEYMESVLGIIGRVYIETEFTPKVLDDSTFSPLYEDVGGNIWSLDQIKKSFAESEK